MIHFGILCPAGDGHLHPMTTLGYELLRRGHRVTVFNFLDAKAKTLASGLEFYPLAEDEFPADAIAESFSQIGKLSGLANDQSGVAARIAWTGVGEVVPLKQLSIPKLQTAIAKVLTQNSYKQRGIAFQEAIVRSGGVKKAVDIIEQVISTGKPVFAQNSY